MYIPTYSTAVKIGAISGAVLAPTFSFIYDYFYKSQQPSKCNIALVYNIHAKHEQWQFISDVLPLSKNYGYNKLVLELPHTEKFLLPKAISWFLWTLSKNMQEKFFEILNKRKFSEDDLLKVLQMKDMNSDGFEFALNVINDHTAKYGGKDQNRQLNINGKTLSFPIKLSDLKSKLSISEQKIILPEIKDVVVKMIERDLESGSDYQSLAVKAAMQSYFLLGMDVDNNKECHIKDIACRDKFMAHKLEDYCAKYEGNILTSVGLSHFNMGKILSQNPNIELIQFYPTDYAPSDASEHYYSPN